MPVAPLGVLMPQRALKADSSQLYSLNVIKITRLYHIPNHKIKIQIILRSKVTKIMPPLQITAIITIVVEMMGSHATLVTHCSFWREPHQDVTAINARSKILALTIQGKFNAHYIFIRQDSSQVKSA